jgi:GntR family transcriptional regulator
LHTGTDHNEAKTQTTPGKQALVRDRLLDLLERLDVGTAIPPERKLAADLGVSRPTLRAVVDELVREGLLHRRHGSGTYVAEPKIALSLTMTSFTEDMQRRGMRPDSQVLSFEPTTAGAKIGQKLRLSPSDQIYAIERLRLADDETMAIEFLHVPCAIAPDLSKRDLEHHSFYDLLRERHGILVAAGVQTIEPTVTNEEEAEILGVPLHAPAFLFERVSTSQRGEVVEFVRSIYRGDRYKLVTELRPARRAP